MEPERPEDPVEEVIQITLEWWEANNPLELISLCDIMGVW